MFELPEDELLDELLLEEELLDDDEEELLELEFELELELEELELELEELEELELVTAARNAAISVFTLLSAFAASASFVWPSGIPQGMP